MSLEERIDALRNKHRHLTGPLNGKKTDSSRRRGASRAQEAKTRIKDEIAALTTH